MELNSTQKKNLTAAIWSGFSALMYVTEPARWPGFAALAEQKTPGLSWTEADRLNMRHDAKILLALAEGSDNG